jgi:hypothetical protein
MKNLKPNLLLNLLDNLLPKENNKNSLLKENNKNNLYNSGLAKDYFYLKVKACDYKDKDNDFEPLSYYDDDNEYSEDIDYPQDIHYSEDYSSQIDEDNYMINSLYFYRLITRYIDFGFTYSFIISYEGKTLTRGDVIFGSIMYTLPKISFKNARFIDDYKAINLKLSDLNRDFIFRLPKRYRDLDINNEDLEYYISYKMLLRYEILKLQ